MLSLRRAGLPAALALLVAPSAAQAQSCSSLAAEHGQVDWQGQRLVNNNPGTALVAAGCMAAGLDSYQRYSSQSEAIATFTLCAGSGCGLTGDTQNCLSVGTQLLILAYRKSALERRMRALGCRS